MVKTNTEPTTYYLDDLSRDGNPVVWNKGTPIVTTCYICGGLATMTHGETMTQMHWQGSKFVICEGCATSLATTPKTGQQREGWKQSIALRAAELEQHAQVLRSLAEGHADSQGLPLYDWS